MELQVKQVSHKRFPGTDQGLRLLVDRAPQAEAFADRVMEKLRPALTWLYGARRRVATFSVALLTLWLSLHVMLGANGMVVYRQKKAEYQILQKDIDALQKENARYSAQVEALRTDPKMIEREAREQLHYARPGEFVYVSPAPLQPQTLGTSAARK